MLEILDIKDLGQTIKETRKLHKLTQEQLAASSGVGLRFLRELEQGKESCQINKILDVINMLGLKLAITKRMDK